MMTRKTPFTFRRPSCFWSLIHLADRAPPTATPAWTRAGEAERPASGDKRDRAREAAVAASQARVEAPGSAASREPGHRGRHRLAAAVTAPAATPRARAAALPGVAARAATPEPAARAARPAGGGARRWRRHRGNRSGAGGRGGNAGIGGLSGTGGAGGRGGAGGSTGTGGASGGGGAAVGPAAPAVHPTQVFRASSTGASVRLAIAAVVAAPVGSRCAHATRSAPATTNAPGRTRRAAARHRNQRPASASTPASACAADAPAQPTSRPCR